MNRLRKRILVVDDEPHITRLVRLNMEQTGEYVVREENQAGQALSAAREFQPDLILLDVLMPGVDGGQLAGEFQASPKFRAVPVIFLTAAVTKEEIYSHAGVIGGLPFLAKPVDIPELIACLRKHLEPPAFHPGPAKAPAARLPPAEA